MTNKKTTKFDFETSLKELEDIVNSMEQGGLSLEESLKLFAQGITLTKKCQEALNSAEQKVKILTGENLTEFNIALREENEECPQE